MKSAIVFTSTLSPQLMNWLNDYSQKIKTTKKAVIEEALRLFQKEMKKRQMAESFKKASQDLEIRQMTEEGMDDYLNQLTDI